MAVVELELDQSRSLADEVANVLFRAYSRRIFAHCLRKLGSREEAEDAAQATFFNAWQSLSRGTRPEAPVAWLYAIADNVCLARHRAIGRRRRVEQAVGSPVDAPARRADADRLYGLDDALAKLSPDQRRALVLREWRGCSYKEIAATMELSDSAVESLIFRARRALAQSLEQDASKVAATAGGFSLFPLGSLATGFKSSIFGVIGGTGAKVAATVAVAATATTIAVAPAHPRLSHALMAPLRAAASGIDAVSHSTTTAQTKAFRQRSSETPSSSPARSSRPTASSVAHHVAAIEAASGVVPVQPTPDLTAPELPEGSVTPVETPTMPTDPTAPAGATATDGTPVDTGEASPPPPPDTPSDGSSSDGPAVTPPTVLDDGAVSPPSTGQPVDGSSDPTSAPSGDSPPPDSSSSGDASGATGSAPSDRPVDTTASGDGATDAATGTDATATTTDTGSATDATATTTETVTEPTDTSAAGASTAEADSASSAG